MNNACQGEYDHHHDHQYYERYDVPPDRYGLLTNESWHSSLHGADGTAMCQQWDQYTILPSWEEWLTP
jgi:hypothetical protein